MLHSKDYGIVAAFDHLGTTTYKDVAGTQQTATGISTSYQAGLTVNVGRFERFLFTAHAVIAGGGVALFTFYARIKRKDANNTSLWLPAEISLGRLDGSKQPSIECTVAAVDLTGKDGQPCDVDFVTTSAQLSGQFEVLVKADHSAVDGDVLYLSLDAGAQMP